MGFYGFFIVIFILYFTTVILSFLSKFFAFHIHHMKEPQHTDNFLIRVTYL